MEIEKEFPTPEPLSFVKLMHRKHVDDSWGGFGSTETCNYLQPNLDL
jgi:hypothetical protein